MTNSIRTLVLATSTVAAIALGATPGQARLNCDVVEGFGNAMSASIAAQINAASAGQTHKINRRKSLRINSVDRVVFDGCDVHAQSNVTLKRKIRRDAHGTVGVKARVVSLTPGEVCIANPKVTRISLSRTLNIGETAYRWAANRTLQNRMCFSR